MNLKTISRPVVMCHFSDGRAKQVFFIAPITEKDEVNIEDENFSSLTLQNGKRKIIVRKQQIIYYGEMDFTTSSEDYEIIKDSNLFNCNSSRIPANYDYNNHTCRQEKGLQMFWETFRPELIVQYFHGLLNKPKYCIIFKQQIW